MTQTEVASYLRVSQATLKRLAGKRQIPAFKIGAIWRFVKSDIDAWRLGLEQSGGTGVVNGTGTGNKKGRKCADTKDGKLLSLSRR